MSTTYSLFHPRNPRGGKEFTYFGETEIDLGNSYVQLGDSATGTNVSYVPLCSLSSLHVASLIVVVVVVVYFSLLFNCIAE